MTKKTNPDRNSRIRIVEEPTPYRGDRDVFFVVYNGDKRIKSFLEFSDAINYGLTIKNKVYYSGNLAE